MPERIIPFLKSALVAFPIITFAGLAPVSAQPTPAPTGGDASCAAEPTGAAQNDTVQSKPDADGYFSLFDGTFKGWWQSCLTGHSSGNPQGAIFRVGEDKGEKAIYTTQRGDGIGGVLMTRKQFTNYEIVFDIWPDYNNDGGLFNRTTAKGRCFQTVLDYYPGASLGGSFGEGGFATRDFRPFSFNGGENTLSVPGNGAGEISNWTAITSKLNPASFGCPVTGCTQAEWRTLWDMDGWNQMKVQFYGGSTSGTGNIHMKSWFRKVGAANWVPIIQDTTLNLVTPAGYIGFQVHGGNRFTGPKGTWYRGIKWKPLDDKGVPIPQGGPDAILQRAAPRFELFANANSITGSIDQDYRIDISDLTGRRLEAFSGKAGALRHAFTAASNDMLMVRIQTQNSTQTIRLFRPTAKGKAK